MRQASSLYPSLAKEQEQEFYKSAEKHLEDTAYEECEQALLRVIWLNPDNSSALDILKRVKKIKEMMGK